MILITGAAGKTGRAVLKSLILRNQLVRAAVYREVQIPQLLAHGAADAVVADLGNVGQLERAVEGCSAIYHIAPNLSPHERRYASNILEAAGSTSSTHQIPIIYHSVLQPEIRTMPHHWEKLRAEDLLVQSEIPFTILRPCAYMQNSLGSLDLMCKTGRYGVPYDLDKRHTLIDLVDVGEAAAVVLTESGHRGATYELCGPAALSQRAVARKFAIALARPIEVEQLALADWRDRAARTGLSSYQLNALQEMFRHYDAHDFVGSSRTLSRLIARPPTDFNTFLRRHLQNLLCNKKGMNAPK